MRPSEVVRNRIADIRAVIARYPVRNPRLFGSGARGEDTEGSDLDILVDPTDATSLFDLAGLEIELSDLLGVKVDVVTPKSLAPDVAARVERDLRPL